MPRSVDDVEVRQDTIVALATPAGRGAVGVVRVSGPLTEHVAECLLGQVPIPRRAVRCVARDACGEQLDDGIALYFPAPRSYTGESVLEFQGHAGPVVMQALVIACVEAGARLARPGEFTQRAFLSGKLDLAQAEAVADLIDAASEDAARSALRSLQGEFSAAIAQLVAELKEVRGLIEATLDFPEEGVGVFDGEDMGLRLQRLNAGVSDVLSKSRRGSMLRSAVNVVLAGRPNVGKSSLLNRLAGVERAIVTPIPGTTRDALRESIQINGVPINVVDTAGLRKASDEIEELGVEQSWREIRQADVVLVVFEAEGGIGCEDRKLLEGLPARSQRLHVFNKCDLCASVNAGIRAGDPVEVFVSAKTGAGLEALREALLAAAGWRTAGETVFLARERHLRALAEAQAHLLSGTGETRWEVLAEELRLAQRALGEITGEFTSDDLLGEIFSRFCIGK